MMETDQTAKGGLSNMPTLRHLQIFTEVARCQKMSEAAQKLYLSQSTVSQAISETEKHYGVLLFERLNKRLIITNAGKELLNEADQVLASYQRLEDHMHELTGVFPLRIGTAGAAAARFAVPICERLEAQFPGLELEMHSYSSDYIKRRLLANEFDVALLPNPARESSFLSVPAFIDQLCFVCGQGHPFYDRDIVSLRELKGQTFLMRESSDSGRRMLEDFLAKNEIEYKTHCSSSHVESIKIFLREGRGIALLSETHVREECSEGILHAFRIEGASFQRSFYAVYLKDKFLSKPLKYFLRACQESADGDGK